MSSARTRLALVGVGVIGRQHVKAMRASELAELVAVADPTAAAADYAADHQLPCYPDVQSLLRSETVDGIVLATPTENHAAVAQYCLERSLPVLIEKPIAATVREAEQLIELSARHQTPVLVGHHRRYYPVMQRTRQLLDDGTLGQLVGINGQWTVRKHDDYFQAPWRQRRAAGPVLTNLIHEVDTLRYLCGEITSVSAEISCRVRGFEKEDTAAVILRFANGALGTFLLSDGITSPWTWEQATGENPRFPHSSQNPLRLLGTEASLEFPQLRLWHYKGSGESWFDPLQSSKDLLPDVEQHVAIERAFLTQCDHFCQVVQRQVIPGIDAIDAGRTLRATQAVFDAAERGQRIQLI